MAKFRNLNLNIEHENDIQEPENRKMIHLLVCKNDKTCKNNQCEEIWKLFMNKKLKRKKYICGDTPVSKKAYKRLKCNNVNDILQSVKNAKDFTDFKNSFNIQDHYSLEHLDRKDPSANGTLYQVTKDQKILAVIKIINSSRKKGFSTKVDGYDIMRYLQLQYPTISQYFTLIYKQSLKNNDLIIIQEPMEGSLKFYRDNTVHNAVYYKNVKIILQKAMEGLIFLNKKGYKHNDVKMENCTYKFENGEFIVKWIDFESVTPSKENTKITTKRVKDPLNPKTVKLSDIFNEEYNSNYDIFSFGIMIYELRYGTHPFSEVENDESWIFDYVQNENHKSLRKLLTDTKLQPFTTIAYHFLKNDPNAKKFRYNKARWSWNKAHEYVKNNL